MNKDKNKIETIADIENKKKNRIIIIVLGMLIGSVVLSFGYSIYTFLSTTKKAKIGYEQEKPVLEENIVEKDWKTYTEMKIKEQKHRIEEFESRLNNLEENQRKTIEILESLKENVDNLKKDLKEGIRKREINKWKNRTPASYINKNNDIPPPNINYLKSKNSKKEDKFIQSVKSGNVKLANREIIKFTPKNKSKKETKKKVELKIPVGFVKGVLLSGSDFPTMQYGRDNPYPVYISVEDKVFLSNNRRLNLKNCLIIGSGWGEVSSERAYILLSKISCITKDRRLIEKSVQGWIMDDDGKTGLRGRLVTKQGAYLARSIIAGFLSGISKILSTSATTVQISPIGTTSTINPKDAFKVGMYSGMGSAAERLAKFYEKMAEQIFPVIEVNGGRRVVIAFKGGNDISPDKAKLELNPLKGGK